MKFNLRLAGLAVSILFFSACSKKTTELRFEEMSKTQQVAHLLSGIYSNKFQSELDTNFHLMHLEISKINLEDQTGEWLYMEQYSLTDTNIPSTQYVLKVVERDEQLRIGRYKIQNAKSFSSRSTDRKDIQTIDVSELKKIPGCTLFLKNNNDDSFRAFTLSKNCTNRLKGATHSRMDLKIEKERIHFLEQGLDEYNSVVWGPKKAGFEYYRVDKSQ